MIAPIWFGLWNVVSLLLAEELGLIRKIDRDTAITEAGFVFFSMSK